MSNYYSNAIEILPGLWIGDNKTVHDTSFLREKLITCIINCTSQDLLIDSGIVEANLKLPIEEYFDIGTTDHLCKICDDMCSLIENYIKSHNILIYCHISKQISYAIIIAYIMKFGKMGYNDTLKAVESKDPNVANPQFRYEDTLLSYEKYLCLDLGSSN
jgi:hypothetical protein